MPDKFSRETAQTRTFRAFETIISGDQKEIDLAQAALLIASVAYPDLDMEPALALLEALAQRVKAILALPEYARHVHPVEGGDPLLVLEALNKVLFEEEGFKGNKEDYYNPDNSCLQKVLEQRMGIPITLSVVYIEVARRAGIVIEGIGLPYHFMVRYQHAGGVVYIDPFAGGKIMDEAQCRERIQQMAQHRVKLQAHWFEPVGTRQILVRMLNNLKRNYINTDEFERALAACDLLLLLVPHSSSTLRERGLIHLQLKHYARALHDLGAYLELAPDNADRYEIKNQLKSIREMIALMN